MRDVLNTPILFLLVLAFLIAAIFHLGAWAARKWNNQTMERFFTFGASGQSNS